MGMYDYLGEEQVKVFYRPIFNLDKKNPMNSSYWHSGGQLRAYDTGDKLPLQELWYKYPSNFLIFDYRFDCEEVWIVRDGCFHLLTTYKELTQKELGVSVFDTNGTRLNISDLSHFAEIKKEANALLESQKNIRVRHFPDGIVQTMRKDMTAYKQMNESYLAAIQTIKAPFLQKWFMELEFQEEMEFGALIDCLLFAIGQTDGKEDADALRLLIRKKVIDAPELPERFVTWVGNEAIMSQSYLEEFLEIILGGATENEKSKR